MRLLLPFLLLSPAFFAQDPSALAAPAPSRELAPSAPLLEQRPPAEERRFEQARKLLDEGKIEEARTQALSGLAFAPYDRRGYQLMLEAATASDDVSDQIRWAKWLYWAHDYAGEEDAAAAAATLLEDLNPAWNLDRPIIESWTNSTLSAARDAAKEKHYRLAGHLFDRVLDLRQSDAKLLKEFDRLVDKAGEQVSGGSFVASSVRRRSAAWIRRQNEKHSTWDKAFERKTRHFDIQTTISYEFFETVSVVMEDMFDFYQDIYDYKKKSPRMALALHRSRVDFDHFNHEELGSSLPLGVLGWFFPKELLVAAFIDDVIYDINEKDVFKTLFHECSHYFMHLLTRKAGVSPGWLNEGTASYFEGCELKADGTIVKNKPALSRVRSWESLESGQNRLSLKELTSYHQPGSYPGHYYPYGWSFVYFLLNYEENDPRITGAEAEPGPDGKPVLPVGPLVYREPYLKYLKSYTKKQKRDGENSWERCVRIFVDEVDDPEIPDWDAFEDRWRRFTQAIVRETKAGPEFADTLQARCRGYLGVEDYERALIAAEQADDKRPHDAETFRLLSLAHLGSGRKGDSIYWMLRHWEQCLTEGDTETAAAAEQWLNDEDAEDLVEAYCVPTRDSLRQIEEAMQTAAEEGDPILGQLFAAHFTRATGVRPVGLMKLADDLELESGRHLRLWQRAFPEASVDKRKGRVSQEDDASLLLFTPDNGSQTTVWVREQNLRNLVPPFAVRGIIQIDGKNEAELWMGRTSSGLPQKTVTIENGARLALVDVEQRFTEDSASGIGVTTFTTILRQNIPPAQFFHFQLEADQESGGKFSVGEEAQLRFPTDWEPGQLSGDIGFSVGTNTAALFRDCEVLPRDAFWPVAPRSPEED